jgi:hypothetical protein
MGPAFCSPARAAISPAAASSSFRERDANSDIGAHLSHRERDGAPDASSIAGHHGTPREFFIARGEGNPPLRALTRNRANALVIRGDVLIISG